MESEKRRKKYTRQFKIDAVSMVMNGERNVADVARELEIKADVLYQWIREFRVEKTEAYPGKGRLGPQEEELRRLRRELEEAKEDRDILKKALAYFSKHGK